MTGRSENLTGAAWMTAGMFGYVVNDAFIKRAAEDLPLFQAVFLRGLVVVALLTLIVRVRNVAVPLRSYLERPLLLRMAMEAIGTVAYLITLTKVPIAGLTAVMQLLPVAVTFAGARLLREKVSAHRVIALLIGLVGVLFIIKPGGDDFSPWFLGGVITVGLIVIRELATRNISAALPGTAVALGTGVVITTMGAAITVFTGWEQPNTSTLLLLASGACFLSLGYVASVNAVRTGDISFTAPFRYSVLIFAIALQIIVFGDVPDGFTFVGSAIVGAAGLYALAHEQRPTIKPTR
ncbi:DMT family transporter [bacterium]|nr:DMT family transporter [Acidimicrobiaceae bacterium]MDA9359588.1 DMT family transporter [bacterium]MDB2392415.1 DMT family transporter [Acidimicrobiaceae bacterium]MDG1086416.1 DMT family transporter [Acidimicrobiales bacterium]